MPITDEQLDELADPLARILSGITDQADREKVGETKTLRTREAQRLRNQERRLRVADVTDISGEQKQIIQTEARMETAQKFVVDITGEGGGRLEQWFVPVEGEGEYIVARKPDGAPD